MQLLIIVKSETSTVSTEILFLAYLEDTMKPKTSKSHVTAISGSTHESNPILFQEWTDDHLRSENWLDTGKEKIEEGTEARYKDSEVLHLPYSIIEYDWKTPSEAFPNAKIEICQDSDDYPDMITLNKHLLQSEFVRSFISGIQTLMYLGNTTQFDMEFATSQFKSPKTGPWRPWHHIYSHSGPQLPSVNKIGKYLVRLFYMGTWRRIYVDDTVPVDMLFNIMLPSVKKGPHPKDPPKMEEAPSLPLPEKAKDKASTKNTKKTVEKAKTSKNKEKGGVKDSKESKMTSKGDSLGNGTPKPPKIEDTVELWPYLLAKALLKIASLTWYEDREMIDFDVIQCLTGWVPQKVDTRGLAVTEIWNLCRAYSENYCWPDELRAKTDKKGKSPSDKPSSKSSKSKGSSEKSSKGGKGAKKDDGSPAEGFHTSYVLARCDDLRDLNDTSDPNNIFPCWPHEFLISQTRVIPLQKSTLTADLVYWKRLRWLNWALENGMVPEEELLPEIKTFRLVTAFKKVFEHVVYKQPSKIALEGITIEPEAQEDTPVEKKDKQKGKAKGEKKDKGGKKEKKEKPAKASKGSNQTASSKGSSIKKKPFDLSTVPDVSFWVDYKTISRHINTLKIYYQPSAFKTKLEISSDRKADMEKEGERDGGWRSLVKPILPNVSRNEPIYIFTESVDSKLIVINFSQTGYINILYPEGSELDAAKCERLSAFTYKLTECDFCLASLIKRVKANITKEPPKDDLVSIIKREAVPVRHPRHTSHFVVEEYDWKSDAVGNTVAAVSTFGTKAAVICLGPGRKLLKLWIKSKTSYVMHLLSDSVIVAGNLDTVLSSMSSESELLEEFCIGIANSFGNLVESFCGPEFPIQLKKFQKSYKPLQPLTKQEAAILHDTFLNVLYSRVGRFVGKAAVKSLRVFLLDFKISHPDYNLGPYDLCNCYEEDDFDYLKLMEKCITRIQAFLRGTYVRRLMRHHIKPHPNYASLSEDLLNIYASIFSVQNRLNVCPNLIRALFSHPDIQNIKHKYDLVHDIQNVLTLKQFPGTIRVNEDQWALICRQLFNVNSKNPIPVKINLFCDLDQYVVRVIDNDTRKEIKRYTNNVAVASYKTNKKGYTVLCYVWSPSVLNVRYSLSYATERDAEPDIVVTAPATSQLKMYSGMYIPNVANTLCKYLVNVRSSCVLLSAHFAVSYPDAIVSLKLYDTLDRIVEEVVGRGQVVLLAICLKNAQPVKLSHASVTSLKKSTGKARSTRDENRSIISLQEKRTGSGYRSLRKIQSFSDSDNSSEQPSSKSTKKLSKDFGISAIVGSKDDDTPIVYRIEANVLYDSWPLNAEEWINVEKNRVLEQSKRQSRGKMGPNSSPSQIFKKKLLTRLSMNPESRPDVRPFWYLDTAISQKENLELIWDTRREDEMMEIKRRWNESDPDRATQAQLFRKTFLDENEYPNPDEQVEKSSFYRTLDGTTFAPKILPTLEKMLKRYMNKDPEEVEKTRRIKSELDCQQELEREQALQEEAQLRIQQSTEKLDKFVNNQIQNIKTQNEWFEGVRNESKGIMAFVMETREKLIKTTLAGPIAKADKKAKGGKKDKSKSKKG